MNIGIVACVYNGYGKFVPEFLEYIDKSTVKPVQVTIVLGKDHGFDGAIAMSNVVLIEDNSDNPNIGRLTNLAIEHTKTDWIMAMDIDDLLLPKAIETFNVYETEADYMCIAWRMSYKKNIVYRASPLPKTLAKMTTTERQKRRINNNSPFRRKLWENTPFAENNWLNIKFIADCVEQGARFVQIRKACIVYRVWSGSLFGSDGWNKSKPQVRKDVIKMYKRLKRYYE